MNIYQTPVPSELLSYWRLNELNDISVTKLKDLGVDSLIYDPSIAFPTWSMLAEIEKREIYLKFCEEGKYIYWNDIKGYY